jgi:hypothetical protein
MTLKNSPLKSLVKLKPLMHSVTEHQHLSVLSIRINLAILEQVTPAIYEFQVIGILSKNQ